MRHDERNVFGRLSPQDLTCSSLRDTARFRCGEISGLKGVLSSGEPNAPRRIYPTATGELSTLLGSMLRRSEARIIS